MPIDDKSMLPRILAAILARFAFVVSLAWVGLDMVRRGEFTFLGRVGVKPN